MNEMQNFSRRSLLQALCAGAGMALTSPLLAKIHSSKKLTFNNSDFYTGKGVFKQEAAKDAYIELMRFHKYPVYSDIHKRLRVMDFGRGHFATMGLAALGFLNEQVGCYMVQDLFLLPNQYLPEHYHEETANGPAKMEGWTVRHGLCYAYGEGPATKPMHAIISPALHTIITVRHETVLHEGQTAHLSRSTARHWLYAGPQGAIITEAASYHDKDGMHFTDTKLG